MNLLKSIFISCYLMAIIGITGYAGWMLYQGTDRLAWIGVILTVAPILSVITVLMTFKNVARTSAHFPVINILGAAGVALSLWVWQQQGASAIAPALALAAWVDFLLYAYWFSTFGSRRSSMKLIVGAKVPYFNVLDAQNKTVSSEQLTDRPAILVFYRANWCPLCMAQLKELVGLYDQISALGVRVAMISPQPHENTIELARKYNVKFDFLTDKGNAAACALGIENINGTPMGMQLLGYDNDTVLPTVVITGRDGSIVWTHETDNYRIRPEPQMFLDVLRRHGVVAA